MQIELNDFPTLQTERLLLREVTKNDNQEIFKLRSLPESMEYMDTNKCSSIEQANDFVKRIQDDFNETSGISWGIELKSKPGKIIGYVSLVRIMKENYRAEVAYSILPDFWRLGIATEAMIPMIKFGIKKIGFHSFEANVNKNNTSSIKLLEKLGFIKEAHFRENYFFNGEFIDTVIYSLLTSEFQF